MSILELLIKSRKPLDEEGQSTIEFALTLLLLMGFTFFFVQLSLVMAWGNYVHYATFMSARALMASAPSQEEQEEAATRVAIRMLKRGAAFSGMDRFPLIAQGVTGDNTVRGLFIKPHERYQKGQRRYSWMQGVRYTFKSRLFLIPFGGSRGGGESLNSVTLTSESWLGRETAYDDCVEFMEKRGYFDNGC